MWFFLPLFDFTSEVFWSSLVGDEICFFFEVIKFSFNYTVSLMYERRCNLMLYEYYLIRVSSYTSIILLIRVPHRWRLKKGQPEMNQVRLGGSEPMVFPRSGRTNSSTLLPVFSKFEYSLYFKEWSQGITCWMDREGRGEEVRARVEEEGDIC